MMWRCRVVFRFWVPLDWEVTHSDGAHFHLAYARKVFPSILWMEIVGPEIDFIAKFHKVFWGSPGFGDIHPAAIAREDWWGFKDADSS